MLDFEPAGSVSQVWRVDLNGTPGRPSSLPDRWAQAFTIWLKSSDFQASRDAAVACIRHVLQTNPFTTLHVVLDMSPARGPQHCTDALRPETLQTFTASCLETTSYLDRYYAMQPERPNGAKRLIVVLPALALAELPRLVRRIRPAWACVPSAALVAASGGITGYHYFGQWAPSRDTFYALMQDKVEASAYLRQLADSGAHVFLARLYAEDWTYIWLTRGESIYGETSRRSFSGPHRSGLPPTTLQTCASTSGPRRFS